MNERGNILVIGDTHLPYEHKDYLDFCLTIKRLVKCKKVVHIGDLVDNHSISYHEHDPDGHSPADEMKKADKHLESWFKAFKKLFLCRGNHDCLVDRKGKTAGLPKRAFKSFREIWNLPSGWRDSFEWNIDGVRFTHGIGYSGKFAHVSLAYDTRGSAVMGHTHSAGGVQYIQTGNGSTFGMNCGCGIDRHSYAMAYGKDFRFKPILGCGVVTDNGRFAQFFPMDKKQIERV